MENGFTLPEMLLLIMQMVIQLGKSNDGAVRSVDIESGAGANGNDNRI